jgi:prepilin-type N-terminal cleavage/methylation domain-containing protein
MRKILREGGVGFTMIELLIVIAVLGILAVAVLAAINPIEQINRGRDTGSRSDAEQMISAIDRFYTNQQFYPWQNGTADSTEFATLTRISASAPEVTGRTGCTMVEALSGGDSDVVDCEGSEELKLSYITRITEEDADGNPLSNPLYIYFDGGLAGNSVYVCFAPASGAFATEANTRCDTGLPDDLDDAQVCNVTLPDGNTGDFVCLP